MGCSPLIYTLTLNPAIDKILFLSELQPSKTNRLSSTIETIGGKGTHVSIGLKLLGVSSIALGISLGENGIKIQKMLAKWGVETRFLHFDIDQMESRTNFEIVELKERVCTMLTEQGPILPSTITDDLVVQITSLLNPGDTLILTGDASNVEDKVIYSKLCKLAQMKGALIYLDASGAYLKEALPSSPFLIKPNLEELCYLAGRDLHTESDIIMAMQELDLFGIQIIAMTWSGNGAIVKNGSDIYRVNPIKVDAINEGGCGDAFLAALVAGIERKEKFVQTLKTASAVASATAESEITAGFDLHRAESLRNQAVVTKIF
ncbi:MAG: 1-phosphofructokinase [Anaerolinea sp.]|nr:1-phosphofructokinase [Anaerolinea sp.]